MRRAEPLLRTTESAITRATVRLSIFTESSAIDCYISGTGVAFRILVASPLRILAVDDEQLITISLGYVFADSRYELTCAEGSEEALATLHIHSDGFDVIIVDHKMPWSTGVELVGAIRERGIDSEIIVLSAHLSPDIREAYARLDVSVMISKPFSIHALRSAVDRIAA